MVSAQELQGNWNSIRGKVKEKWGQLTDDDLQIASGNVDQLYGRIQQKTGQTKQQIQEFFSDLLRGFRQGGEHATGDIMEEPRRAFNRVSEEVSGRFRDGYHRAEQMVQEHPGPSMAGVFLGGVLTGLCIGVCASSRRSS
jgi:uncharacterized protein YjbJ (UPF0337 family)